MTHMLVASALLGSLSLASLTYVAFHVAPATQNPKNGDVPTYTGQVGAWWVAAPGRVQFQIVGSGRDVKDGKHPDLWFETPADKDLNTLFENLVLDLVVYSATKGVPLTVEAKTSSGDDGSTAAKAYDVLRVGIGRT